MRSWKFALLFTGMGLAFAAWSSAHGSRGAAVVELVVCVVLGLVFSPLAFPRSVTAAEASQAGRPIVYWRPGCQFCLRLRVALRGSAGQASWVNIWTDPEAAAAVRAIADGNETVPTVVSGSEARVNPAPRWVREQLGRR
ncbi:glutaredoxin domain-containing protein [Kribbella sp. NPDC026611]|uniref:glutaredoxin domain-containing protein n=1 Tax=Kribbella sp. NPDC026611 TaxID=3154911 RepID=UPI0033F38338